jgi:hypothetical protein
MYQLFYQKINDYMKHLIKIIIILVFVFLIVNLDRNEENLDAIGIKNNLSPKPTKVTKTGMEAAKSNGVYLVNDSLYKWDEIILDWVNISDTEKKLEQRLTSLVLANDSTKPIVLDWNLLQDIEYQLKYYEALSMEIYSPVFPKRLKAIDGKKVIIEGYVIPFDESGNLLALSANPFASCFFCGKASPASVMSLYPEKKKRYRMDDFRRFQGVLKLNYDDPEEYYYILHKAIPAK